MTAAVTATGICQACRKPIVRTADGMWQSDDSASGLVCYAVLSTPYTPHKPEPKPGDIVRRPVGAREVIAALNRAEGTLEEDAGGWCGDCREDEKCPVHLDTLDDAAVIRRLREAIEHASDAEVADLLFRVGEAA